MVNQLSLVSFGKCEQVLLLAPGFRPVGVLSAILQVGDSFSKCEKIMLLAPCGKTVK